MKMNQGNKILFNRYVPASGKMLGGMSEAIICKDKILTRDVVIKTIKNTYDIKRLLDEINALQRVRSKHVVEIYDIIRIEQEKKLFIVEEYLPGSDLFEHLKNEISEDHYLKLLYQIISGLKDIHLKDLIHRDIKPNNMKFDGEGYLKIFDFGLSRFEGVDNSTVGFKGTRVFAAPELYGKKTITFTKAIDIFAFGVSAWLIGKNKLPDSFFTPPIKEDNIIDFNKSKIKVPSEIANILNQTLKIDSKERPSSIDLFEIIARHLLHKKHRANIIYDGELKELNSRNSVVELSSNLGKIKIQYDGFGFKVEDVSGEIFINNTPVTRSSLLPGSCVITFGNPSRGASRNHITFDTSHPEVTL